MMTERQSQVLEYIKQHQAQTGNCQTAKDICQHFGWRSPNAATCHIKALRKKGYIMEKQEKKARMRLLANNESSDQRERP